MLVAVLLLFGLSPPALAQQITYEYDALGRLILITSPVDEATHVGVAAVFGGGSSLTYLNRSGREVALP
jgi:hypothetical protein